MSEPTARSGGTFTIELSESERQLVRTALKLLEDTLTHEEADELEEVQALLARLRQA
jgi:hypothetical protein